MKDDMVRRTVRLPRELHDRLKELKRIHRHLSLNALLVEALQKGLAK